MKRFICLLLPILFLVYSCKNDDSSSSGDPIGGNPNYANPHLSGSAVSADFTGRITSPSGMPVANALVEVGGQFDQTNELGYYQISNASTDQAYAVVKVQANGYFKQFRSLKPRTSAMNYVDITMIALSYNAFFDASAGGSVTIPGGAKATFPANALVDEDGNAYTGQVILGTTYLDPTDPFLPTYMPGSLQAVNAAGENAGMITYGMVGVEMLGGSGQPLQLAPGKKATLEFPVQAAQMAHAPDAIPLWFFDEVGGIWREEGSAVKTGNLYIGEVSHFSFWNCDIPVSFTTLSGTTVNEATGEPLGNLLIVITRPNGGTGFAYVGPDGYFSGIVPADELLIFAVGSLNCSGESFFTMEIGPLGTVDVDLGNVELTLPDEGSITVNGTVVDCDSNPLAGIVVQLNLSENGIGTYTVSDDAGQFSMDLICVSSGTSTFELVDFGNLETLSTEGPTYNADVASTYDEGNLSFCDAVELEEYFTYIEGSNSFNFDDVTDSLNFTTCHTLIGTLGSSLFTSQIQLSFELVTEVGVADNCPEWDGYVYNQLNPNGDYYAAMSNQVVTITDFEIVGGVYTLLKGTYTADVTVNINGNGTQETYNSTASGSFKYQP